MIWWLASITVACVGAAASGRLWLLALAIVYGGVVLAVWFARMKGQA